MSREIGIEAEDLAVDFLEQNGYKTLARNFTIRGGEIDIIAEKDDFICFVEVKYRQNIEHGYASDYITKKKMAKLLKTAKIYLYQNEYLEKSWRIDAVVIDDDRIELLENVYIEGMAS